MAITKLHGMQYNKFLFEAAGVRLGKLHKILYYLSPFIHITIVVFSLFYISFKFIQAIFTYFGNKGQKVDLNGHHIGLNFTNITVSRFKTAEVFDSISDWIIGPEILLQGIKQDNIIDYKSYLSLKDYFCVLKLCLLTIVHYCCNYTCLMLLYRSWSFFEIYMALKKISPGVHVYFANQSDNWAIMFDNLSFRSRTLIQHGYLGRIDLPIKLKRIDRFYALSKSASEDALESLFIGKPDIAIMKSTINLTDFNDNKFKVLLVLNLGLIKIEEKIITNLKTYGVSIYLKKHPSLKADSDYSNLAKKFNLNYIKEDIFPLVDFVISYNSTLAYEYMAHDIPVYIYTNDNKTYIEDDIFSEINLKLKHLF